MLEYRMKEIAMEQMLENYQAPIGFRSSFKAVPMSLYESAKYYIDFTKYYVCFRGPRKRCAYSTLKRDAHSFDVYKRDNRATRELRIELEAFKRGVKYGQRSEYYGKV